MHACCVEHMPQARVFPTTELLWGIFSSSSPRRGHRYILLAAHIQVYVLTGLNMVDRPNAPRHLLQHCICDKTRDYARPKPTWIARSTIWMPEEVWRKGRLLSLRTRRHQAGERRKVGGKNESRGLSSSNAYKQM